MTTQTPLVAIKCITYNQVPYIRQCLDGFIMQRTDFPFVAIVHDDCSTDGTDDIVREYAQRYPNIIKPIFETENQYSKGDGSLSRIMTQACNNTGAKYIAMCEGDDYWTDPLKLQKQVDFLENHPECSCCVHEYKEWIENEKRFRPHQIKYLKDFNGKGLYFSCSDYSKGVFFTKTLTAVYRYSALIESNYEKYKTKFDMALFFALSTQGKIYLMNETMGVYRMHDGGVTSDINRQKFYNYTIPKLFSICEAEKSKNSQRFVYMSIREYPIAFLLYKPHLAKQCLKSLGLYFNARFFIFDVIRIAFRILSTTVHK